MKNTTTEQFEDTPEVVTNTVIVHKTSNWTRLGYFMLGVIVSAIMLYNVPDSAHVAQNIVGAVVKTTPKAISGAADWVGGKIEKLENIADEATESAKPVGSE